MKKLLREIGLYILIAMVLANLTANFIQNRYDRQIDKYLYSILAYIEGTHLSIEGIITLLGTYQKEISEQGLNLAILNKIAESQKKPDFERLLKGTVSVICDNYMVGGVNIKEDDEYYYILTVWHFTGDRKIGLLKGSRRIMEIPESSMGLSTRLEVIHKFLESDEYSVPTTPITNITIRFRDNIMKAGELIKIYEEFDLALIRVTKSEGDSYTVLNVSEKYPKIGDRVYIVGHPNYYKYVLTSGIVSSLEVPIFMMSDAMMSFGSSGGGVFNTDGEVIGICSRVPLYFSLTFEE